MTGFFMSERQTMHVSDDSSACTPRQAGRQTDRQTHPHTTTDTDTDTTTPTPTVTVNICRTHSPKIDQTNRKKKKKVDRLAQH